MKLNRKLVLVLALVLSVAMATTGTLAYLTDRDSAANVFTMGNVKIKLNEEFDQGSTLLPGKEIKKKATITNEGNTDAWVWMSMAVPSTLDHISNAEENIIHMNVLGAFRKGHNKTENFIKTAIEEGLLPEGSTGVADEKTWDVDWSSTNAYITSIGDDSVEYRVYNLPYVGKLAAGETTNPGLYDVYMDSRVDISPDGDMYFVSKGNVTDLHWNINTDGNPTIYVSAYAIQAEGFDDVYKAMAAYNAQWTTESGVNNGLEWGSAVSSQDDLTAALNGNTSSITLSAGEYTLPAVKDKTVTITGNKNTVIDMTKSGMNAAGVGTANLDITFDGVTVKFDSKTDYKGIQHAKKVTYKNCTLIGKQFMYADDVEFINCTFENYDDYAVWTYGSANVTFENCTFLSGGKAILVYGDSGNNDFVQNVAVTGCSFYSNGAMNTNKAAIEVHAYASYTPKAINLTMTNNVVYGFAVNSAGNTSSKLYSDEGDYKRSSILNVTENSNTINDPYAIASANGMFAFAKAVNEVKNTYLNKTVMLTADIDLQNQKWTPIGQFKTGTSTKDFFCGTFDGNNHTIKNLYIDEALVAGSAHSAGLFGMVQNAPGAIKNLTIDGATVRGYHNVGVVAGYYCGLIEKCHVENAIVVCKHGDTNQCGDKAGVIVGYKAEGDIKDCSATNSSVTAARDAGQIVGWLANTSGIENNTISSVNVTADSTGCSHERAGSVNNGLYGNVK